MCGFVGWIDTKQGVDINTLAAMRDTLRHRGPDDVGIYQSPDGYVGLGFRRLSIIDLSPAGHQPMCNEDGTVWIVFNGEVYNFAEIRPDLEARGHVFKSCTDTEVILHAYEQWGEHCVDKFIGMFAFAIWDSRTRILFAARDRLGIKPFYYSIGSGRLLFASELKPILLSYGFDKTLDTYALRNYLARGYICPPRSIFKTVRSLPPGYTLTWTASTGQITLRRYWDPLDFCTSPLQISTQTEQAWTEELDALLRSSIRYRLISDVPLGAFLSGGIDSSLIVALMRQVSTTEVKTFTVGFHETTHDEAVFAEKVARHLGVTHTQLTITQAEAQQVVSFLPNYYDEPFADSSQIPTYLVSRLTRQFVTVALSGDGGDELFCGYESYQRMARWQHAWLAPQWIRNIIGQAGNRVADERIRLAMLGLTKPAPLAFADYYASIWRPHEIDALVPDLYELPETTDLPEGAVRVKPDANLLDQLMLTDLQRYLPHDILTKVDRASMAVSLEVRVPLLDHRIVQFALKLPLRMKWRNGMSKYLLRQILYRHVPRELIDRPKHGFGVPLDKWLRGDLHQLINQYLNPSRLKQEGLFDPNVVQYHVDRFMAGRCGHARVWSLLMFQMWSERYVERCVS